MFNLSVLNSGPSPASLVVKGTIRKDGWMLTGKKLQPFQVVTELSYSAMMVVAAFLLRLMLVQRLGTTLPPFILFYPIVIFCALLFGLWAGVFATMLSAWLTAVWALNTVGDLGHNHVSNHLLLSVFSAMGILISAFAERCRRAQVRITTLENASALHASRAKLEAALASMQESVFITDSEGEFVDCNDAFVALVKCTSKEECPKSAAEFYALLDVVTSDGTPLQQDMWPVPRALRGETATQVEYTATRNDTHESWTGSYSFGPIRDKYGTITGAVVAARDITEQKRIEEAMRASEIRYRTAFQTSLDAIAINRLGDGLYVDANDAFLEMTGYDREEVVGRTSLDLDIWAEVEDRENMVAILQQRSRCRDFQGRFRKKNGEVCWGMMSASTIDIDGEPFILSVIRDISDARLAREEIRNLAFFDPLTKVANRRLLIDRLEKSISYITRNHGQRALLSIDLDDFTTLNGTIGHEKGDLLLREVAERISSCVREIDTVGRVGADEFFVIIESLSKAPQDAARNARAFAENILTKISQPYDLDGYECTSTCCIGITIFADNYCEVGAVMQQADLALSQAKAAGKNQIRIFVPQQQSTG